MGGCQAVNISTTITGVQAMRESEAPNVVRHNGLVLAGLNRADYGTL